MIFKDQNSIGIDVLQIGRHLIIEPDVEVCFNYSAITGRKMANEINRICDELDPPAPITREGIEGLGWVATDKEVHSLIKGEKMVSPVYTMEGFSLHAFPTFFILSGKGNFFQKSSDRVAMSDIKAAMDLAGLEVEK